MLTSLTTKKLCFYCPLPYPFYPRIFHLFCSALMKQVGVPLGSEATTVVEGHATLAAGEATCTRPKKLYCKENHGRVEGCSWEQRSWPVQSTMPLIHLLLEGPTRSLKGMPAHVHTQIKVFVKGGQQCTREGKRKWGGGPICQSTAALELNRDFSEVLTPHCHNINIMMINVNWLFKRPYLVKDSWLTSAIKCFIITMFKCQ